MRSGSASIPPPDLPIVRMVRWVARILGTAMILFVVAAIVGGASEPFPLKPMEALAFVPFIGMIAGLAIAWRREGLGGVLVIACFAAFWIINMASSGRVRWLGGAFPIFPFVGFLYLFCWRQSVRTRALG